MKHDNGGSGIDCGASAPGLGAATPRSRVSAQPLIQEQALAQELQN